MSTQGAMLRSRHAGGNCPVHGHPCEVSQSRPAVSRTQDKARWRRDWEVKQ